MGRVVNKQEYNMSWGRHAAQNKPRPNDNGVSDATWFFQLEQEQIESGSWAQRECYNFLSIITVLYTVYELTTISTQSTCLLSMTK